MGRSHIRPSHPSIHPSEGQGTGTGKARRFLHDGDRPPPRAQTLVRQPLDGPKERVAVRLWCHTSRKTDAPTVSTPRPSQHRQGRTRRRRLPTDSERFRPRPLPPTHLMVRVREARVEAERLGLVRPPSRVRHAGDDVLEAPVRRGGWVRLSGVRWLRPGPTPTYIPCTRPAALAWKNMSGFGGVRCVWVEGRTGHDTLR